jgi:murein DD-endopeptidase MepM/ murein hydrolase activator NlpD
MAIENVRERKEKHRYTFVVVPDAKSKKTRTFSAPRWGLYVTIFSVLIVLVASIVATIVYTPVGRYLPISNPDLAKRYGKEISDIQRQLQSLVSEVKVLRGYNTHLRKVMGEKFTTEDSIRMVTGTVDTTTVISKFWLDSRDSIDQQDSDVAEQSAEHQGETESGGQKRSEDFITKLPLTTPVDGFVTEGYDPGKFHYGIDFTGKEGSPVLAAADGNVAFAGWTFNDGFMLIVLHELGYTTVYKHNKSLTKSTGDAVKRGELIAQMGNTGERSNGAHLHFEVWKNGITENPIKYLLSNN